MKDWGKKLGESIDEKSFNSVEILEEKPKGLCR